MAIATPKRWFSSESSWWKIGKTNQTEDVSDVQVFVGSTTSIPSLCKYGQIDLPNAKTPFEKKKARQTEVAIPFISILIMFDLFNDFRVSNSYGVYQTPNSPKENGHGFTTPSSSSASWASPEEVEGLGLNIAPPCGQCYWWSDCDETILAGSEVSYSSWSSNV